MFIGLLASMLYGFLTMRKRLHNGGNTSSRNPLLILPRKRSMLD
jgi:hypothetical protein